MPTGLANCGPKSQQLVIVLKVWSTKATALGDKKRDRSIALCDLKRERLIEIAIAKLKI